MSEVTTTPPFQTQQPVRKVSFLLGLGIFLIPAIFSWFTLRAGHSVLSRVLSFGWLVLILLITFSAPSTDSTASSNSTGSPSSVNSNPESAALTSDSQKSPPVEQAPQSIQISARELFQHYEANEVAADRHFKGQILEVTGRIQSIDSGIGDGANVHLSAGDEFGINSVTASGNNNFDDYAASLSKNQNITLRCKGGGEVIGQPFLENCTPI